jgi:RimJ/RimL family protein N-acetyltransferase
MTTPALDQPETDGSLQCAAQPLGAAQLEGTLTLRDGTNVRVRPIRADDTDRLRSFHMGLSRESIVFRFFRILPELPTDMAEHFTHVDYTNRMAILATTGDGPDEQILAVVRYDRIGPTEAEVAFVVADQWQGHGIATALLYRLAAYARQHGFTTFVAFTMGTNQRMLEVLRYAGFPHTTTYCEGEVEVRLDITAEVATPLPCTP